MFDIRGVWLCISAISSGIPVNISVVKALKLEFDNTSYKMYRNGECLSVLSYVVKSDQQPMILQLFEGDGNELASQSLMSYDGMVLSLCKVLFSLDLPSSFESEINSDVHLMKFVRANK